MLKMVKDKNIVIINTTKVNNVTGAYKCYEVICTKFWNKKPYNTVDFYSTKEHELIDIIEMFEDEGYTKFETPTEWKYKFIRMC